MDLTGEPLDTPDSLFMNETGVPLLGVLSPIVGIPLGAEITGEIVSPEEFDVQNGEFLQSTPLKSLRVRSS